MRKFQEKTKLRNQVMDMKKVFELAERPRAIPSSVLGLSGSAEEMGKEAGSKLGHLIFPTVVWRILSLVNVLTCQTNVDGRNVIESNPCRRLKDVWTLFETPETVIQLITSMRVLMAHLFHTEYKEHIPPQYMKEMMAFVTEANKTGAASTRVDLIDIILINHLEDFVSACVLSSRDQSKSRLSRLMSAILSKEEEKCTTLEIFSNSEQAQIIRALGWFKDNYGLKFHFALRGTCDTFVVKGADGNFLTQFSQFPTVERLFENLIVPVTRVPNDGRYSTSGWSMPGLIGWHTCVNSVGLTLAGNLFSSSMADPALTHTPYTLELRMVGEHCGTTSEALKAIYEWKRGCPCFITAIDREGICSTKVMETYASTSNLSAPTANITSGSVKKLLPKDDFLVTHSPLVIANVVSRHFTPPLEREVVQTNKELWALAQKDITDQMIESGPFFSSWRDEEKSLTRLRNDYFLIPREPAGDVKPSLVVQTNSALSLIGRCTQMSDSAMCHLIHNRELSTWRYEELVKILTDLIQRSKPMGPSTQDILRVCEYISPSRPQLDQYPSNREFVSNFGQATNIPIQGCMSVFNLSTGTCFLKAGAWNNGWVTFAIV